MLDSDKVKEVKALRMVLDQVISGDIELTPKQLEIIHNLNNELYRGIISKESEEER